MSRQERQGRVSQHTVLVHLSAPRRSLVGGVGLLKTLFSLVLLFKFLFTRLKFFFFYKAVLPSISVKSPNTATKDFPEED